MDPNSNASFSNHLQTQECEVPTPWGLPKDERDMKLTPEDEETALDFSQKETPMSTVDLFGIPIVSLKIDNKDRLCLAQISNTLLRNFSYNEIHNRRVALGITCLQCTPVQLEVLRRTGAMPVSSRRCGLITKREAERLVKSFLEEIPPPKLPENFSFHIYHKCGWGCKGEFIPSRYNSSRAKCIKCTLCGTYFSPNKFIFHFHKSSTSVYRHPDAANFNSWRRHIYLADQDPPEQLQYAWEDVKSMFNGGCRKKVVVPSMKLAISTGGVQCKNDIEVDSSPPLSFPQSSKNLMLTSSERAGPSFQLPRSIPKSASYGEMLRSLSMHYNSWWKPWYLGQNPSTLGERPLLNLPFHNLDFQMTNLTYNNGGSLPRGLGQVDEISEDLPEVQNRQSEAASNRFNIASIIGRNWEALDEGQLKIPKPTFKSATISSSSDSSNNSAGFGVSSLENAQVSSAKKIRLQPVTDEADVDVISVDSLENTNMGTLKS